MCKSYSHKSKITRFICAAHWCVWCDYVRWAILSKQQQQQQHIANTHTHTKALLSFRLTVLYTFHQQQTYIEGMCQLARTQLICIENDDWQRVCAAVLASNNNRAYQPLPSSIQIFIAQIDFSAPTRHPPPPQYTHNHIHICDFSNSAVALLLTHHK